MSEAGGFEAYAMFHALKLHFTSKYDYVKYSGKTNVTKDQFMLRKDKFQFYKLSRKYKRDELFGFFVGQVMKASQGSANPQAVNELLKAKLG